MKTNYDTVILGAGPAGLTAALYCGRYNLKTIVVGKSIGGTVNLAGKIENWPGFIGSGKELMQKFKDQAEKFGAEIIEEEIVSVKKDESGFITKTEKEEIHSRSIIIALGTENRKLDIPGEKEFIGKGVSYCATCDGNFFKEKTVAVIGGADSAAKAAIYLSEICKKVYIIYRREKMKCEPISFEKIKKKRNVEIIYNAIPIKISGDNVVKKIKYKQDKEQKELEIDGVFIQIGAKPSNDIIKELKIKMDKEGYIITDEQAKTSIAGVFAAGDNTNNKLKQVVTAASEGAIAANSVYEEIRKEVKLIT